MIRIESCGNGRHLTEVEGSGKELMIEFSMIGSIIAATLIESGATIEEVTHDLSAHLAVGIKNYREALDITDIKGGAIE